MEYIKKPAIVEALQFSGTEYNCKELGTFCPFINFIWKEVCFMNEKSKRMLIGAEINKPEAIFTVHENDYVIKDGDTFYVCKPDIFEATYEVAE